VGARLAHLGPWALALLGLLASTSSATSSARHPLIAAAGDIACDPFDGSFNKGRGTSGACRQLATSSLLLERRYAAVLALGDIQYPDGSLGRFFFSYGRSWGRVKRITRPAPGNHEYETEDAEGYFRYFGKAAGPPGRGYYSFDVGRWHLVSLNSNCSVIGGCHMGSPQERWLRRDLAQHRAKCTLAYWHHPRFSSGRHGSDDSVSALWNALYEAGADVVLVAHDHHYERFAPLDAEGNLDRKRGMREFVVGTGGKSHYAIRALQHGSQVRNDTTFGILAMTLEPAGYEWQFVPAVGSFTDRGSGRCR
jgi:hypothetical protein